MVNKIKRNRAIRAWQKAIQRDLDKYRTLKEDSQEQEQLGTLIWQAVLFVTKEYGVTFSISEGWKAVRLQ